MTSILDKELMKYQGTWNHKLRGQRVNNDILRNRPKAGTFFDFCLMVLLSFPGFTLWV